MLVALAANVAVGVSKLLGFLLTGSVALLAECLHSLADSGNQGLLLLGARRARAAPTQERPFGRGRERYFWAFVVWLILFGLGGVVSIIEGVRKLGDPSHGVDHAAVALTLIGVAALFEASSLRVGVRAARRSIRSGAGLWQGLRESRDPEVAVVVYEDTGALIGLTLAASGIGASALTDNGVFDAAATIAIGMLLCGIATRLTIEMHSLLIGEPATALDLERIRSAVSSVDGVASILNLRTEHIGPDDLLVCVKVAFSEPVDFDGLIRVIDEIEAGVVAAVPATLTCYVEPDRRDSRRIGKVWT